MRRCWAAPAARSGQTSRAPGRSICKATTPASSTATSCSAQPSSKSEELSRSQDGVLGGFGDAEFDDFLGGDLDRFAGGGIPAHASFAVHQHEFAQAGQSE